MAKNKKSKKRHTPHHQETSTSAVSVAAAEPDDDRFEGAESQDDSGLPPGSGDNGGGSHDRGGGDGGSGGGRKPSSSAGGPGFFEVYKPGQGYYTRLGTAIGGGAVVVFGANYLYGLLSSDNQAVKMGVPAFVLAVLGVVLFWIAGSNRKTNDFFIATEGEMKKVSWSTKKEVIGSTKVVLAFTFLMASFLFIVDGAFIVFFSSIDVLKLPIRKLLGLE